MGKLSVALKDDKVLSRLCHFAPSAWLKLKRTSRLFTWRLDDVKMQQMQQTLIEEFHLVFVDAHEVCERGDVESLWLLLTAGVSVKLRDSEGATLLQKATHTGLLPILQLILERGGAVNAKGAYGYTPLHEVAYLGHSQVCAFLLENKANYDALSKNGSTPLMVASREGHTAVLEVLLRYGADAEDGGDKAWTPLHVAIGEGHMEVCRLLTSYGASAEGVEGYLSQLDQHAQQQVLANHEEIGAMVQALATGAVTRTGNPEQDAAYAEELRRQYEEAQAAQAAQLQAAQLLAREAQLGRQTAAV